MRLRVLSLLALLATAGCARLLDRRFDATLNVVATPKQVLSTAAAELEARKYSVYTHRDGRLYASQSELTPMFFPAAALAIVAMPVFVVTWPVVGLVSDAEIVMWWPIIPLSIPDGATIHRTIEVTAASETEDRAKVTIEAKADERGIRDARAILEHLRATFAAPDDVVTVRPIGSTR